MRARDLFALGAMLTIAAAPAAAQFTTVVAPPKREAPAAEMRAAQAAADTGRRTELREMSAWVDSVAGTTAPIGIDTTVVDSAAGVIERAPEPRADAAPTERFRDGARAPDTASALPLMLLLGLGMLGAGVALFVTRGRSAAPARTRAP